MWCPVRTARREHLQCIELVNLNQIVITVLSHTRISLWAAQIKFE